MRQNLSANIANGSFPDRTFFLPHIPKKLRKVIVKALSVDPNDRHPNVLSLMNELAAVDEMLNWKFSLGPQGERTWEYQDGDLIRRVRATPGQSAHDVVVSRINVDSGKETYLRKDSTLGVAATKLPSVIYDALRNQ